MYTHPGLIKHDKICQHISPNSSGWFFLNICFWFLTLISYTCILGFGKIWSSYNRTNCYEQVCPIWWRSGKRCINYFAWFLIRKNTKLSFVLFLSKVIFSYVQVAVWVQVDVPPTANLGLLNITFTPEFVSNILS